MAEIQATKRLKLLKPSIIDLPYDEAIDLVIGIRQSRLIKKASPKKKKRETKVSPKNIMLGMKSKDEQRELLKLLKSRV